MSPEQARGQPATFKSDIWAAGIVLAECLTGRPPLQGSGGGNDLLRRRAEEPPVAPSAVDPSIPPDLDKIVLKACALDPEERYSDAAEMARALRAAGVWSVPYAPGVESLLEDMTGEVMLPDDMEPTAHLQKPEGRRRPRARSVLKGAGVALLMALIAFAGIKSVPALMGPAEVEVPEVAHLARDDAARRIREAGLRVEVVRKKDKFERRSQVLTQTPASGVLEEGSTVTLVVSAGPPVVKVPSVVGMRPDPAEKLLHEKGRFDVGEIVRKFSLERIGSVIAQSPDDGRLPWGSTLTLTVSKGPEPMEIPSVAGLDPERAKKKIENARLVPVMVDAYSDDVPAGGVIGTEPGAGEVLLEGSEIEVYLSVGPEFEELSMPDVRGMTVKAARAELEGIGLRVRVVESCKGGGTVGETDPLAGTTVRENDLVALFVC
jgi:eukaryotic-like serine/threonine-protein kinase